jgi:hypothetical protein
MQTIKTYPTMVEDLDLLLNSYASLGARRLVHDHYKQGQSLVVHNNIRNCTDTLNEADAATVIHTFWKGYTDSHYPDSYIIDNEYTLTWH